MSRNEDQTRKQLIDPALAEVGWTQDLIKVEKTPGGTDIIDGNPRRRQGRVDYLLHVLVRAGQDPIPVAVIEAKRENELPALGLQQARSYQKRFNVPFVFSSNGHLYAEWADDTRRVQTDLNLADFPSPDQLRARWEALRGFSLDSDVAKPLLMPYKGGRTARFYFQDAAIRAAIEKIAKRDEKWNRILISLATGTGKTVVATQLLHKLAQAGQLNGRVLFLVDRDELRTQAMNKLQNTFGDNARIVTTNAPQKNATILIASYQTLNVVDEDKEPTFWRENYPPGFFSYIVIDECHRSAWNKWSVVLEDNKEAVHIGLTATPRIVVGGKNAEAHAEDEVITAHNLEYFGEPIYEYKIWEGQEDGYLAACEITRRSVNLDAASITREDIEARSAVDPYTGKLVNPSDIAQQYTAKQYEQALILPDRIQAMCEDIFQHLLDTGGPHQKTIIFCASKIHAVEVSSKLTNLYEQWCEVKRVEPRDDYAFVCMSGMNPPSQELIKQFRGSGASHYIATTKDLLSTGVDIPNLNNVVFFRYLESSILFYQIVGRGTRIGEPRGTKFMFRLYDYTNSTRLFGQPFESRYRPVTPDSAAAIDLASLSLGDLDMVAPDLSDIVDAIIGNPPSGATVIDPAMGSGNLAAMMALLQQQRRSRKIKVEGFDVTIAGEGRSILSQRDGQDVMIPWEEYKQEVAERLLTEAIDLAALRNFWISPPLRRAVLKALPNGEASVRLIRALEDQNECDLFDVLAELAYGALAKSRAERTAAFVFQNRSWLRDLPEPTVSTLTAITRQFEKGGIEELETEYLFDEQEVINAGGFEALLNLAIPPDELITQTKLRLLAS